MELHNNIKTFHAKTRKNWRKWLEKNHESEKSVWLIIYKKESETPSIYYPEAVDEALCFGWIDSKPNKRDEHSYYQFFSKRNPKSNWSKVNKEKILPEYLNLFLNSSEGQKLHNHYKSVSGNQANINANVDQF